MRKRFFIPLFVVLVFFPIIIYVVSYTRFFNDEVRTLLVSLVDDGTNARLRLGEIHGSVFGSFTIDGAVLLYRGEPIAMVDTVKVSHLPLSLITETVEATRVELVNPRFFLVRYRDGSFNVDHIGKPGGHPGGKFNWTILARSIRIVGGEFSLIDSTSNSPERGSLELANHNARRRFDISNFKVKGLAFSGSADFSNGDNLSVHVGNMSMLVTPPGLRIDSLGFGLYSSPGGTEITGLRLKSGRTVVRVDLTLTGQSLLYALNGSTIRDKYFTARVYARDADLKKVDDFVKLPIQSPSDFNLSFFASGTLDTLKVKQCLVKTDSSVIPLAASFRNLLDSTMYMNVRTDSASVNMPELSDVLKNIGFPDVGGFGRVSLTASVVGPPRDLEVNARLSSRTTAVSCDTRFTGGSYKGQVEFSGLDLGRIIHSGKMNTDLNGKAAFALGSSKGPVPEGDISVNIDSSHYDGVEIGHFAARVSSARDSVGGDFNALTSSGNIDGKVSLNPVDESYFGDVSFSELDPAPFVHVPALSADLTGRLQVIGRGFNADSLRTKLSLITEHSSVGRFHLGASAFTVALNTETAEKDLQIHSPYFDVGVTGSFTPHLLPSQLQFLFSSLADSFSSRLIGATDTSHVAFSGVPHLHANLDLEIKDAGLVGQLLGNYRMSGGASTHLRLVANRDSVSVGGSFSADTILYVGDSLRLSGSKMNVVFGYRSSPAMSVWDSAGWYTRGRVGSFDIGATRLAAKNFFVDYTSGISGVPSLLKLGVHGSVDSTVSFGVNATGAASGQGFEMTADTLEGNVLGVPLNATAPVNFGYSSEAFGLSGAVFSAGLDRQDASAKPIVTVSGLYSLKSGANLRFLFDNFGLRSIQKIARLDTSTLRLKGALDGRAELNDADRTSYLSVDFMGHDIYYNGSVARNISGKIGLGRDAMSIQAQLSKEADTAGYALKLDGTVPLSSRSREQMRVDLVADSLNMSFLTPFLTGVNEFGGMLSGNMNVTGEYSSPLMHGRLTIENGKLRLAANDVRYLYSGLIIGEGNKLRLDPVTLRNVPGQTGGTINATGFITIGQNTIQKFDLLFDGSLLVLNSPARRTLQGIYGTAIVGSGRQGLRLEGSLRRPMLLGALNIQSADLTLLPIQRKENLASQEIVYHFPKDPSGEHSQDTRVRAPSQSAPAPSGSFIDSLRYDVEVETKDNVNLRMIFDPTTNEELNAVLGGRLHLSNLSGSMELTGNVSVQNNSYYNFYGRHFAATGELSFTGNPLNPMMDITAQYQGELVDTTGVTSSTGGTKSVVVQLGISGTFDHPNAPDISMTVDGVAYQGDVQTNAISFILTNQFADQLTSPVKRSLADNLWNQAGAGILSAGTSILSGALTNLFSREFSFIRSAELRYSSISDLANPDVAITTQFGKATIRVGGQVFSDINNTDLSVDYPLTELLGNMLYLQLSHKIALNSRTYFQRETVNALRLFYQLSF